MTPKAKQKTFWYPTRDDILRIHHELVALFAGTDNPIFPPGPKDVGLIESACGRPRTALGSTDKYDNVHAKGAALFHSLLKNHPFHNGNKRTALLTLVTFLWRNDRRFRVDVTDDEVFNMVVGVANDTFLEPGTKLTPDNVVSEIAYWLGIWTVPLSGKPAGMRTQDFLDRCKDAGCSWKESGPSYVVLGKARNIRISKSTRKLDPPVVREYLNKLGLRDLCVEEFQAGLDAEQNELRRFRGVLRRLAHA